MSEVTPINPTATSPAAGTTRVELKYPVTVNGLTCDHVDIRRLKVRDIIAADRAPGTAAEKEVAQFAALAGVAPNVIEGMDAADYIAVQNVVKGFLPQRTA